MYQFIESIRVINGKAELLHQHLVRIERTCKKFYIKQHLNKETLFHLLDQCPIDNAVYKLRILYGLIHEDKTSEPTAPYIYSYINYSLPKIESLQIVHDDCIDYSYKYSNRSNINTLFEKRLACDDVLIVRNGLVTETSYCNIAFYDGVDWFSPEDPLLYGTRLTELISNKMIFPAHISVADFVQFTKISLFNSMIPWSNKLVIPISNIFAPTH